MTKAEQDGHLETLEKARVAAEKAVRRVMEELGSTGLLSPLNAINNAFAVAQNHVRMMKTEEE